MKINYVIPECNVSQLNKLIEKINKAANKLNLKTVSITKTSVHHRQLYVEPKHQSPMWINEDSFDEKLHKNLGTVRNWLNIEIDGETPKFKGWTFFAVLTQIPVNNGYENQIRKVPGVNGDIPKEYRSRAGECDHCKTIRKRNETYVVGNDNGEFKMVGSTCIKDFLGHDNPHEIANYLSSLHDISILTGYLDEEDVWGLSHSVDAYGVHYILELTSAIMNVFGWKSKGKAYEDGGISTASIVEDFLQPESKLSPQSKNDKKRCKITIKDTNRAASIFEWMKELDPNEDNDYLYNLSLLSRSQFINTKSLGLLCSAVSSYDRAMAQNDKNTKFASSKHIGVEKERLEFNVKVLRVFERENEFGVTRIHSIITDDGNCLTWFCSGAGFEEGFEGKVKATIKGHTVFNGIEQTVVSRVSRVKEPVV